MGPAFSQYLCARLLMRTAAANELAGIVESLQMAAPIYAAASPERPETDEQ